MTFFFHRGKSLLFVITDCYYDLSVTTVILLKLVLFVMQIFFSCTDYQMKEAAGSKVTPSFQRNDGTGLTDLNDNVKRFILGSYLSVFYLPTVRQQAVSSLT